jgi:uncharacterized membrane protein
VTVQTSVAIAGTLASLILTGVLGGLFTAALHLAYAGGSLPLLLLIAAGNQPVGSLLTGQFLAQEIMRSAVGTIGLVASLPITTALATLVADL